MSLVSGLEWWLSPSAPMLWLPMGRATPPGLVILALMLALALVLVLVLVLAPVLAARQAVAVNNCLQAIPSRVFFQGRATGRMRITNICHSFSGSTQTFVRALSRSWHGSPRSNVATIPIAVAVTHVTHPRAQPFGSTAPGRRLLFVRTCCVLVFTPVMAHVLCLVACFAPQCHMDTYGDNVVVQVSGRKRWTLFPPSDTPYLYPLRVPFEESSVFSEVNVASPDLTRHPLFAKCHGVRVTLSPGDALFVPRHTWHFVEGLDTAVAVNLWCPVPGDVPQRAQEAIVRTLFSALHGFAAAAVGPMADAAAVDEAGASVEGWVNPTDEVWPAHETVAALQGAVCAAAAVAEERSTTDEPAASAKRRRARDLALDATAAPGRLLRLLANAVLDPAVVTAVWSRLQRDLDSGAAALMSSKRRRVR